MTETTLKVANNMSLLNLHAYSTGVEMTETILKVAKNMSLLNPCLQHRYGKRLKHY
jgi:hypothetical protein